MKRYERRLRNMIKDANDQATIDATRALLDMYTARYDELLDLSSSDDESDGSGRAGGGDIITNGDDDGDA